jgi:hypothetical protein
VGWFQAPRSAVISRLYMLVLPTFRRRRKQCTSILWAP